jgi:hypothetical protein
MGRGAQLVNELFDAMFVVGTATEDGTGGKGHVEGVPGDVPPCEHGALPGFSSGVASGDRVAIVRRRSGAVSLGSLLKPTGEQVNDRTVWTPDGLQMRLRAKKLEVTGSDAADGIKLDGNTKVVRQDDPSTATVAFQLWLSQADAILRFFGLVAPLPTPPVGIVEAQASSTKVGAG